MNIVALIPARAGSKRIPGKNTRLLAGHPLIAYSIAAAKQSGVFGEEGVWVCTDDPALGEWADDIAGVGSYMRERSADAEPDIKWIRQVMLNSDIGDGVDCFAILRPTSPFRSAETIKRAWSEWSTQTMGTGWALVDSLRAMQYCGQHPGKMWRIERGWALPLLLQPSGTPWHSMPTQSLPPVYVQNASLEIAWTDTVKRTGTIAGERILPFMTGYFEGLDLNTEQDWWIAERALQEGVATLPAIE